MAKFLQSRAGSSEADEVLTQNVLSMALLRSLIAGDFDLEPLGDDFLLLHEKGIFVLKQSHRNGIIQGEAAAPTWLDRNYLGDAVPFANPILENMRSMEKLSQMLKLPTGDFHSCIVFDNQCELRSVPQNTATLTLLRVEQLEAFFATLPQKPLRYSHTQLEALKDIFLLVSGQY